MWWLADTVWRGCVGGGAAPTTVRCISCSYSHNPPSHCWEPLQLSESRSTCTGLLECARQQQTDVTERCTHYFPRRVETCGNKARELFPLDPWLNWTHTSHAGRCDWNVVWIPFLHIRSSKAWLDWYSSAPLQHSRREKKGACFSLVSSWK